jgi:uncharacterized surface protein with fasciclin (FAS1) repeats
MSRKQIALLAGLLLIALAALGIGYGLWSEILVIDGVVASGNVDVAFTDPEVWDVEDKDVGECYAWAEWAEEEDGDVLVVEVYNGYPGYECYVEFGVKSWGTIPVHIYQPELNNPSPEELTVVIQDCYQDDTQLHKYDIAYCTLWMHVNQEAAEGAEYGFSAEIEARQYNEPREEELGTIVDIAVSNPDFSILVDAVIAADLVDALAGDGPFTVFAPTNAAFVALLEDLGLTAEELLADTDLLEEVLLYHVVSGKYTSTDIVGLSSLTTLQGDDVAISVSNGDVFINESQVIIPDIMASNGVVHVIDEVLLPPAGD